MLTARTRNITIFSILYLIVSAAVLGYVVFQTVHLGVALQEQSVIIAKNNTLKKEHTELLHILKQTASEREQLESFLLTEDTTVHFLTEVEQLALTQRVKLTTDSLVVSEKKDDSGFKTLSVRFSLEGDKTQVRKMLKTLENLPYHGQITELSLIGKGATIDTASRFSGKVDLELSLLSL